MDAKKYFDSEAYFAEICSKNRLAQEWNFKFCTCGGINQLTGPLQNFRDTEAFFCIDDTNDGSLFRGRSGGWFKKRTFTVFLLHRYEIKLEESRISSLHRCREIFRQVCSRMLIDSENLENELVYLHTENILARELGQYFLNGCTGLYFMIDVSEPVDLTYNSGEWTE
ncbi:hypothetical protein [uncultured Duncaniella sp.]|uniref:hypothetical protein n=1 Tax=uncultured Duncaniella sp. TaxID=2768039 RepID=UPI0025A9D7FC|nr:hypothetical protein [uncultured Duncaniella sp.]